MAKLLVLYIVFGLALFAIAVPLAFGQVAPGAIPRLRVAKIPKDPRLWYEASAYVGALLIILGAIIALTAVVLVFIPGLSVTAYAKIEAAIIVLGMGSVTALGHRFVAARHR